MQVLTSNKPLTDRMVDTLMECHERELMHMNPLDAGCAPSMRGLVARGLVDIKYFITDEGKEILSLYITREGKKCLQYVSNT